MDHRNLGALTAVALLLTVMTQAPAYANLIVDPGFESPITYDGPPFVGFWEGFNGGGAASGNANVMPHGGLLHLRLAINGTPNTFAGAFQDVAGLTPGQMMVFGGWHMTPSAPLDLGVEVRIEWRNSVSNTEISRTPNLTAAPVSVYTPFALSATVPVGADVARLVYAVQSFSTAPLGSGEVYVDDVSFDSPATPAKATTWGRIKSLYK